MTVNEVRKIKNLPPLPEGNVLFKAVAAPAPGTDPGADDPNGKEPPDGDEPAPKPKKGKK